MLRLTIFSDHSRPISAPLLKACYAASRTSGARCLDYIAYCRCFVCFTIGQLCKCSSTWFWAPNRRYVNWCHSQNPGHWVARSSSVWIIMVVNPLLQLAAHTVDTVQPENQMPFPNWDDFCLFRIVQIFTIDTTVHPGLYIESPTRKCLLTDSLVARSRVHHSCRSSGLDLHHCIHLQQRSPRISFMSKNFSFSSQSGNFW